MNDDRSSFDCVIINYSPTFGTKEKGESGKRCHLHRVHLAVPTRRLLHVVIMIRGEKKKNFELKRKRNLKIYFQTSNEDGAVRGIC